MIYKRVNFEGEGKNAYLDVYVANPLKEAKRKAILVIPGGAYAHVSDREGEAVGQAFMPYGYNAFVLNYSVSSESSDLFPRQLIQASKAIKYIKDNAEEFDIDPEKVFVVGFSAGGHLAASVATMWDLKEIYDEVDMPVGYNKPAGAMLCYPVISAKKGVAHEGSFLNLFGVEELTDELREKGSIENHVSEKTCPVFLMHTAGDPGVPVQNSLLMAQACAEKKVPFEMHVLPGNLHGISLANRLTAMGYEEMISPAVEKWVEHATLWAENL